MSKEYLSDKEKMILLSALSNELKLVRDNDLIGLIAVVKDLDYKFKYDRLFKQIEDKAYLQGIADERSMIVRELEKLEKEVEYMNQYDAGFNSAIYKAIEIVRGEQDEQL